MFKVSRTLSDPSPIPFPTRREGACEQFPIEVSRTYSETPGGCILNPVRDEISIEINQTRIKPRQG